jgi:hypothetical protein
MLEFVVLGVAVTVNLRAMVITGRLMDFDDAGYEGNPLARRLLAGSQTVRTLVMASMIGAVVGMVVVSDYYLSSEVALLQSCILLVMWTVDWLHDELIWTGMK